MSSPSRKNGARDEEKREFLKVGVCVGVYISISKSAPGKFLFKLCLQKVFTGVFSGISWFLTDVNDMNLLTLCVYLLLLFKNFRTLANSY